MKIESFEHIYFLGIGGIGMSALARYFRHAGKSVSGYDKTPTPLTDELINENCAIHFEDWGAQLAEHIPSQDKTLVVLTPAIPKDHQEWAFLQAANYTILKRSQVLGIISQAHPTIGVAGTHGKTTTSTLIAHLFKQSSLDCMAFLGGISANYSSNLLLSDSYDAQTHMVVEADEYDRSFLTLFPQTAIITAVDADHLDIYGDHAEVKRNFVKYAQQTKDSGFIILKKGLEITDNRFPNDQIMQRDYITYAVNEEADFSAQQIRIEQGEYYFDLHTPKTIIPNLHLGIPGAHNVENATAASAAALLNGMSEEELRRGLDSFRGVKRRFEYIIKRPDRIYVDDYAHHPEEIRAILGSLKKMYPNKTLTIAFQPHLYTRTRDFASGFSEALSMADAVFLLPIYPARELPIDGVNSEMLLEAITSPIKLVLSKSELVQQIEARQPELFVSLGAGDIDQLVSSFAKSLA